MRNKITNKLKILFSLLLALIIILGFTLPVNLFNGWYQQFMPSLNGRAIQDITFLDSLTGYAITNSNGQYDTAFILKTTNAGDSWFINYSRTAWFTGFNKIKFINSNTGFVCGVSVSGGPKGLTKTTNAGVSWNDLNIPDPYLTYLDMSVQDENTIWLVSSESLTGGVFHTTNGGASWIPQFSAGTQNPNKIYMFNQRIGFMSNSSASPNIYKTTNGGLNWFIIVQGKAFNDIYFVDSLKGWSTWDSVRLTTNGGINWTKQILPSGGIISAPIFRKFSFVSSDTIWGSGSSAFYGSGQFRGILFRTTNGGINWLFQVPDTSIHIVFFQFLQFVDKRNGWAYHLTQGGVHTTKGGDPVWYTGIQNINNSVPKEYKLYQNYPNPFNPRTVIKYELKKSAKVNLNIYDIQGKDIIDLVNQQQSTGTYSVDFSSMGLSSGIYFYSLYADNKLIETKRMILIK